MGTNYYLTPKEFKDIDTVNQVTLKALNEIRDNYCKSIEDIKTAAINNHKIYKDSLDLPDTDNIQCILKWEVEIPEIHICKVSFGWNPLFESNKHYNSFKGFKDFYNKYKDDFIITDEYNRQLTIDEFESIVTTAKANAKEFHTKYNQLRYNSLYS